jgi:hypothetical protein
VLDFLEARGYQAKALDLFPGIVAELPKAVILELNQTVPLNLGTIYWGGIEITPQLDSTAPTIRAPVAWERGYTGQGVTVAVVDGGPINPAITHGALQGKILAANAGGPTDDHAARVASIIVGDHPGFPEWRGIAYGSDSVLSVDVDNSWQSINNGLNWALDRGAQVLNLSITTEASRNIQPEDRVLDYVVRHRWRTIVGVAGNYLSDTRNVKSPAKGYNVLTVGGFADQNNASWSDDSIWGDSNTILHLDFPPESASTIQQQLKRSRATGNRQSHGGSGRPSAWAGQGPRTHRGSVERTHRPPP